MPLPSPPGRGPCPSEQALLASLLGSPEGDFEQLLLHLDACEDCRRLIAEAAQAPGSGAEAVYPPKIRTFSEGQLVADRYRIFRFLARGMGEVYLAEDLLLEEQVALKTLSCTALDDPRAAFRFKAEARLARRVTHPNVCRVLEFGVQNQCRPDGAMEKIPFLTMEFLVGETLSRRLARRGRISSRAALPLLRQVLAGLQAIHACGIVHRDLKSENVFLVPEAAGGERVVTMDFGLARALDSSVVSTWPLSPVVAGTIDTMAPEQIEGRTPEPAMDVFAFGVLAFEVLAGRRPFIDMSPARRLRESAVPPSSLVPDLPRRWDAIIGRCLELKPSARYTTLSELDGDLRLVTSD